MKVALSKQAVPERAAPEGVMRDNDDWIYAEYAGTEDFRGIDVELAPAAPLEQPQEQAVSPEPDAAVLPPD
jgi:penicillin-binding protein 1A